MIASSLDCDKIREAYFFLTDLGNGMPNHESDQDKVREIAQNLSNVLCDLQGMPRHSISWQREYPAIR